MIWRDSPEEVEKRIQEQIYRDLRDQKAEGIYYYLSRGWKYTPSGMNLNNSFWNCDECQKNRYYPALKYRSAKDPETYEQGIYVCSVCKSKHGYNNDPDDTRGSLLYYHKEWEVSLKKINDTHFIVPRLMRQIHEYAIYKDLESLMWIRKRMSKSTLANPSPKELALSQIIERLRVNYVSELNTEESICVLSELLKGNRIKAWQSYMPSCDLVFNRFDQSFESLWDKYPFPVLNSTTMDIAFKYYDCRIPRMNSINTL